MSAESEPEASAAGALPGVSPGARPGARLLVAAVGALLAIAVARVAWMSDDAYISFRALDNLVHGRGLVWNVDERVQAFTNTLWVLVLAPLYSATGNIYWSALALSLALTVGTALVLARKIASGALAAAAVLGMCAASKAFVEYSTSGLEGALLHFVLACGAWAFLLRGGRRSSLFVAATLFSLSVLTRPDAALFTGPWLAYEFVAALRARGERRAKGEPVSICAALAAGLTPLVAWELFSLWYYGFPLPNSAYAKLSSGLPRTALAEQGLAYLANSLRWDPLTLLVIGGGLGAALWPLVARGRGSREPNGERAAFGFGPATRPLLTALAIGVHLVYILRVGGDFMSGRFLTAPFVVAVALLARLAWRPSATGLGLAACVVFALANERGPWRTPRTWGRELTRELRTDERGIADERAVYFQYTGVFTDPLLAGQEGFGHVTAAHPHAERLRREASEGQRVSTAGWIGIVGYWAGPGPHVVDRNGLADPLLARLPIAHAGVLLYPDLARGPGAWRVGHYARHPPAGYLESLAADENLVADPRLAEFYGALRIATRGALGSRERWRAIWDLNRGRWDEAIAAHGAALARSAALGTEVGAGAALDD